MRVIAFTLCCAAALAFAAPAFADPIDRQVRVEGANGGGFIAETDRYRDGAGGFTVDRDVTFRDGSTRSVDVYGQVTGPGTAEVDRYVTQRDGDIVSQSGVVTSAATPNGRLTTGVWEGANGTVLTTRETERNQGVRSTAQTTVFSDGSSRSAETTVTATGQGQGTVTQTVTGRNGGVREREGTYTVRRRP